MMALRQVIETLELEVLTAPDKDRNVHGGYASDLLSCVMAGARQHYVWVTLQSHMNVVAVASLLGLTAVIITEGKHPEPDVMERAQQEGVVLLLTPQTTFTVVGKLTALGIKGDAA
jgi:hypothetical protein